MNDLIRNNGEVQLVDLQFREYGIPLQFTID